MILLRSLLFNLWFYLVTLALALAAYIPRAVTRSRVPQWAIARAWARWTLGGLRLLTGARWQVSGLEHLPQGPALIASMHQSAFDTMVWMLLVPRPCYVLKRELVRLPVFGAMCRATEMIAVDRDAGGAAIRGLLRETDRAVAEGRQIVIFPEGTRMPPGQIGGLQPGIAAMASRSRLPVIPVATNSGLCWGRRAFRKRAGTIHVAILPPLPAGLPRAELLVRLEQAFAAGAAALAVENSGGKTPSGFASRTSGLAQPIDE